MPAAVRPAFFPVIAAANKRTVVMHAFALRHRQCR